MHDINFFATYKRSQSKDKTFVVFLIILVVVTLLINTGLFVGRSIIFNDIKEEIQLMKDFINNPATRQAIDEANRIQTEAEITAKYLELLLSVDQKLDQLDVIESDLLLRVFVSRVHFLNHSGFMRVFARRDEPVNHSDNKHTTKKPCDGYPVPWSDTGS